MKRAIGTVLLAAMMVGTGSVWADDDDRRRLEAQNDVTALQPIRTYGDSPEAAREHAKLLAQTQCDQNILLIRAFRELRGTCRYEQGSGQWHCYGQKFRCEEQH